jgi:hypothetical protein
MNLTEVLIMVVGAALGYLVVSSLMGKPRPKASASESRAEAGPLPEPESETEHRDTEP